MTVSLKHAFTSAKSDGADATQVQPSNWNAEHTLTLAADKLLGRDSSGAGAAQEISCTAFGRGIIASADVAAWKTATGVQATSMTWTAAQTVSASFTAGQAAFLTGAITPTGLVGDTNDWAPTSFSTSNHVRMSSSANCNLTGLAGGADGRLIVLDNVGSFVITLVDESASSTAANRFALAQNLQLRPDESIVLIYDGTSSRWRVPTKSTTKAPTVQLLTSGTSATYTTPAGCTYLRIRMVGGGGGGGGAGTTGATNAGTGGTTSFTASGNTTSAVGGTGAASVNNSSTATAGGIGGTGGTSALGTVICRIAGGKGGYGMSGRGGAGLPGLFSGKGASSPFGDGGSSIGLSANTTGITPSANSGAGGGGGHLESGTIGDPGGGGSGEYVEFYIAAPAATYTYSVGAAGTAGSGTGTNVSGGAGAAGIIIVEEFYV